MLRKDALITAAVLTALWFSATVATAAEPQPFRLLPHEATAIKRLEPQGVRMDQTTSPTTPPKIATALFLQDPNAREADHIQLVRSQRAWLPAQSGLIIRLPATR